MEGNGLTREKKVLFFTWAFPSARYRRPICDRRPYRWSRRAAEHWCWIKYTLPILGGAIKYPLLRLRVLGLRVRLGRSTFTAVSSYRFLPKVRLHLSIRFFEFLGNGGWILHFLDYRHVKKRCSSSRGCFPLLDTGARSAAGVPTAGPEEQLNIDVEQNMHCIF